MSEYIVKVEGQMPDAIYERELQEVVRCRECEYISDDGLTTAWCGENCREVRPNDYCAWGERRENE